MMEDRTVENTTTTGVTATSVVGPDGREITMKDLPKPDIRRWVTRRKAEVVAAVRGGLLTLKGACERYSISEEEFAAWEALYDRYGSKGLRVTRLQQYRETVN